MADLAPPIIVLNIWKLKTSVEREESLIFLINKTQLLKLLKTILLLCIVTQVFFKKLVKPYESLLVNAKDL